MYAQINIGRSFNVEGHGKLEMRYQQWENFKLLAEAHLERFASQVTFDEGRETEWHVEVHEGIGIWADQRETSAHLSLTIDGSTRQDNYVLDCIRELQDAMSGLCHDYYQDVIALIIAGSYTNHDGVYYAN